MKQRVVGAAVLVALGVVFIPILLDESPKQEQPAPLEVGPKAAGGFSSKVVPLDDETIDDLVKAMDATPDELEAIEDWEAPLDPAVETEAPVPEQTVVSDEDASTKPIETAAALATAPVRTGVTAWVVQVGSFGSEENAKGLVARLRKGGHRAFIEPLHDDVTVTYRVRVGPVLTKSAATSLRERLTNEVELKGIVLRYP